MPATIFLFVTNYFCSLCKLTSEDTMRYYGLSLSNCVKDILNGEKDINDVILIITGTNITNRESLMLVAGIYMLGYWQGHPLNKVISVLEALFFAGKILQPRVMRIDPPNIAHGHWIDGDVSDIGTFLNIIEARHSGETCEV